MGNDKLVKVDEAPSLMAAFVPTDYDSAFRMAATLAKSGLLGDVRTPEAAFLIMATGAELGIPPTMALRGIYVIQGKPVLSADMIVALCLRHSEICERFALVESSDKVATYETKRRNCDPVKMSFSLADAERAGLVGKSGSGWSKYPSVMLRHRAASMLARAVYPDLVLGVYCQEEADEIRGTSNAAPVSVRSEPVIDAEVTPITEAAPEAPAVNLDAKIVAWSELIPQCGDLETLHSVGEEIRALLPKSHAGRAGLVKLYATREKELKAEVSEEKVA